MKDFKYVKSRQIDIPLNISNKGNFYFSPSIVEVDGKLEYISIPSINERSKVNTKSISARNINSKSSLRIYSAIHELCNSFKIFPIDEFRFLVFEDKNKENISRGNLVYVTKKSRDHHKNGDLDNIKRLSLSKDGLPLDWDDCNEIEFQYFLDKQLWKEKSLQFSNKLEIESRELLKALLNKGGKENKSNKTLMELMKIKESEKGIIRDCFYEDKYEVGEIAHLFGYERDTIISVLEEGRDVKSNGKFNGNTKKHNE